MKSKLGSLKCRSLFAVLLGGVLLTFTSAALATTYEQTYYDDGADHFMDVYLQSGGTHSFFVNGVPWGSYNYVAYEDTGSGYTEIWSDSTSTGWDPTFSTYVSPGNKVKLVIYDGSWNVKSVYYWYIVSDPDPTASRYSPTASSVTLEYDTYYSFQAHGQDAGGDLDYADWTLSGPETDTDHDYWGHSSDIISTYSHTYDVSGDYNLTCVFTDESGDTASVSWSIHVNEAPDPPTVTAGTGSSSGEVDLSWTTSSGATGYVIVYDEDGSSPWSPSQNGTPGTGSDVGNVTQQTISGLAPGQTYYFAVAAYNSSGLGDYSSVVSAIVGDEPNSAQIVHFDPPPTDTLQRGTETQATVRVKNTGTNTRSFWVGLSFAGPGAQDWPVGWFDIRPMETNVLAPGEEEFLTFTFKIRETLPAGAYDAYASVWDDYDADYHLMEPYGDPFHEWNNGNPEPSFSLDPLGGSADSIVELLLKAVGEIAQDYYFGGNIAELYEGSPTDGRKKPVLYMGAQIGGTFPVLDIPVAGNGGGKLVIDLVDLFEVDPEGEDGWVTIWVDGQASGGIGINTFYGLAPDFGITMLDLDYNELSLADDRKEMLFAVQGELFGFAFTALSWSSDGGLERPHLGRSTDFPIQGLSLGLDADGLVSLEVNKNEILQAIASIDLSNGLESFLKSLEQKLYALPSSAFRDATMDDGSWPLYDGELRTNLKCSEPGEAHHFFIDVPSGSSELRIDVYGGTGDADLYVRAGDRPSLQEYTYVSTADDNEETIVITNPSSGKWYIMVYAYAEYDGVTIVSRYENSGTLSPIISVTPSVVDFGSVSVDNHREMLFTVENTGYGTLSGSASVTTPYSIESGGSYSLTHGQEQTVTVRFSPTSLGTFNENIIFTGADGAVVPVSGEGAETVLVPLIASISNESISEGLPYSSPAPSLIQGTQPITYSLITKPSSMTIDIQTGVVSWTNPTASGSPHQITIQAANTAGYDDETWELTVNDNLSPTADIITPSSDQSVPNATTTYYFSGTASDLDGTITEVEYRVRSGAWQTANGTTNWDFTVDLEVRANLIEVRAQDNNEAYGDIESRTITREDSSYIISGQVALNGGTAGVTDVLLTLSGAASQTTYPKADGTYNFTGLEEENYTITPSLTDYYFFPSFLSYSPLDSDESNQDFTGLHETYDSDTDNLPDWWEQQIINADPEDDIDSVEDVNPGDNFDNDVWTNYEEYINGTDPTDASSPNNAPTAPALNYPVDDDETTSREPTLSVSNSTDLDGHILTYSFEVYSDPGLASPVTSVSEVQEGQNTTAWQIDVSLDDNSFYYWRTKAYDGIDYSVWMDTAKFFVNTSNDPPSIPTINSPPDQSEVTSLQPALEVNNANDIDFDQLTYEFEVYPDESMSTLETSKTGVFEGNGGTTSWDIDISLQDNTFYWWRAQARDNEDEASGWTSLFTFFVNTANDAPTAPSINSPQEGEEVDTLEPALEVNNSTDANLDTLTYFFEIDKVNTFNTSALEQSPEVTEGAGDITSWVPSELVDNTTYYWRVRAYDGAAYSQWTTGSFFVSHSNNAPTTPTISNPGDNSEVTTLTPTLVVNPSTDVDLDQISYDFELYSDSNLSDLVTSTSGAGTSWQVDMSLVHNARYYWRARAVDEHGAASDWSTIVSFLVNVNSEPEAPTLNNPISGGTVTSLKPSLSVNNSTDPDNDTLEYEFEVYSDVNLSIKVASSTVSQGNLITSWTVFPPLTDNSTYYWRVRANDGMVAGSWMPTAVLVVNTSGADTIVDIEASEDVSASATTTQTVEVTDIQSPINGVCVEIPPGALSNDCTITISVITNPPALPDNTKAIGKVVEFGPAGITFLLSVSIMIPYTQTDLDNAGVSDPADLEVFTYNTSTLSWEQIPVDSVDEVNAVLLCKVDHFSMFTKGSTVEVTPPSPSDEDTGDGDRDGNCFIATASFK